MLRQDRGPRFRSPLHPAQPRGLRAAPVCGLSARSQPSVAQREDLRELPEVNDHRFRTCVEEVDVRPLEITTETLLSARARRNRPGR